MPNPTPVLTPMPSDSVRNAIEIRPLLADGDATAFRTLNEEWITRHFVLEPKDIETLGDPGGTIFGKGGRILMAYADAEPVGCVALIPMADGLVELAKMAVDPQCRGRGIGRRLLERAIEEARSMGAAAVFLGSSTKLPAALHLYESVGFRRVQPDPSIPMPYTRADVFMRLSL